MYKNIAKTVKFFTKILRLLQVAGISYFVLFIIYWGVLVMKGSMSYLMDGLYYIPINLTTSILKSFNWSPSPDFVMLHPEVFYSIILTFIVLILYNFIFIPLGSIEKYFVEKSFDKGEHKY